MKLLVFISRITLGFGENGYVLRFGKGFTEPSADEDSAFKSIACWNVEDESDAEFHLVMSHFPDHGVAVRDTADTSIIGGELNNRIIVRIK